MRIIFFAGGTLGHIMPCVTLIKEIKKQYPSSFIILVSTYKDDKYIVNLEVTKSIKDGSSNELETILYTGESNILADAFLNAKNSSDKYVYMEHVNILLVSKNLCNKGKPA